MQAGKVHVPERSLQPITQSEELSPQTLVGSDHRTFPSWREAESSARCLGYTMQVLALALSFYNHRRASQTPSHVSSLPGLCPLTLWDVKPLDPAQCLLLKGTPTSHIQMGVCFFFFSVIPQAAIQWSSVLVSWGCLNKALQTRWFKTIQMYSLTVLEARKSKKIKQSAGPFFGPQGRICSRPSLLLSDGCWSSLAVLGLRQHHSNLCLHLQMVSSLFLSSSHKDTSLIGCSDLPHPIGPHRNEKLHL